MPSFEGVEATVVSSQGSLAPSSSWVAAIDVSGSGVAVLEAATKQARVLVDASSSKDPHAALSTGSLFITTGQDASTQQVKGLGHSTQHIAHCRGPNAQQPLVVALRFSSPQRLQEFKKTVLGPTAAGGQAPNSSAAGEGAAAAGGDGGGGQGAANAFDAKMDKGSADLYFHYYGMLQHQQNMLQDVTRTGTYYSAILENAADFAGKSVMDVGAGSGILSLFAAQAGAAEVYAVEASGMANFARQLAAANPSIGSRVKVLHTKVEEVVLPGKVDVLVSEPMGTLLVNERMLETYLYARDHFLKPGGAMFPALGRIHCAAFSDVGLYSELYAKASFWSSPSFYGVNLTALHTPALEGYFAQVVVDAFDPSLLVSNIASKVLDFRTMAEAELHDISVPLDFTLVAPCTIHGIACWFDVLFDGTSSPRWLTTAPGQPTTHWFQLRCVLQTPIMALTPQTRVTGTMRLVAHERQSYDVLVELHGPPLHPLAPPQHSTGKFDLKEPYYRQLTQWPSMAQQQQQQMLDQHWEVPPSSSIHTPPAAAAAAAAPTGPGAASGSSISAQGAAAAAVASAVGQQQQQVAAEAAAGSMGGQQTKQQQHHAPPG